MWCKNVYTVDCVTYGKHFGFSLIWFSFCKCWLNSCLYHCYNSIDYIAYYDDHHKQAVSIDLLHEHRGVRPHRHEYMSHNKNDPGISPTDAEEALIRRIKKEFGLK